MATGWVNATISTHTSRLVAFIRGTDVAPEGTLWVQGPGGGGGKKETFPSWAMLRYDTVEEVVMVQGISP